MIKKIVSFLVLFALFITMSACVEHIPAVDPSGASKETESTDDNASSHEKESNEIGEEDTDEGETSGGEESKPFVIKVTFGGEPYLPDMSLHEDEALKVRLTDGKSYYTERLGADGTLTVEGLDGDYTVTLLDLPKKIGRNEITYDPNIYKVSNDQREIEIELLPITVTVGDGYTKNEAINLKGTGIYRAEAESDGQVIYHLFTPKNAGRYCIESMMDISAEMYNPKFEKYNGNAASGAWYYIETIDGGGSSGSYTKNFRHIIEVDESVLGSSYLFGILVEGKDAEYPVNIDFSISYLGVYDVEQIMSTLVAPEFIPSSNSAGVRDDTEFNEWIAELNEYLAKNKAEFGSSNYSDAAIRKQGKRIFDQSYYKLNPDDGLYHVYDIEKYASTNGYGPILYADITSACMFFESALNVIEYAGSKALTLCEGTVNYKLFIEGYDSLIYAHSIYTGPYFCISSCPCYLDYENGVPGNNEGACSLEDNCKRCTGSCRHPSESMKYQKGYADIANEDGRVPVTEELKIFLQRYSISQKLFSDGNGFAETHDPRYDAYEDSQWLFACGYYSESGG